MSDLNTILERAKALGQALADNDRFQRVRDAEDKVRGNEDARKLSHELNEQMEKILDLEQRMQPVEPEDKVKLEELRGKVHANEILQELARVQADYMEMMAKVNETIQHELGIEKPQIR